jgi:hypothetical protein
VSFRLSFSWGDGSAPDAALGGWALQVAEQGDPVVADGGHDLSLPG